MANYIIKKWIEPYVLLETLKSSYDMTDLTFDGFSKNALKEEFLKELKKAGTFGLYMKNVNKFYIFNGSEPLDIEKMFNLDTGDYVVCDDYNEPLKLVDFGKAEAGIIFL